MRPERSLGSLEPTHPDSAHAAIPLRAQEPPWSGGIRVGVFCAMAISKSMDQSI